MSLPSTAWQPGQSGNPHGSIPIKLMRDTLMLVLNEESTHKKYKGLKRLRRVADTLVAEAESGNVIAIKEILDRVDGKVPSDVKITSNRQLAGQSYDELAQSIAEALIRLRQATGTECTATLPEGETEPLLVDVAPQQGTQQS